MKKGFNILMIFCAVVFVLSCDKNKSYTDMLKDERKAIERFIDEEGIEVLKNYPENGVFKENQFVKLSSDIYLNVVDSGNGNRASAGTDILLRASGKVLLHDTFSFNGFDPLDGPSGYYGVTWPLAFKYGAYSTVNDYSGYFFSVGLASGLEYVGDSSIVKLIVPFKHGSSFQQTDGKPIYFDKVRYIFEKK